MRTEHGLFNFCFYLKIHTHFSYAQEYFVVNTDFKCPLNVVYIVFSHCTHSCALEDAQ